MKATQGQSQRRNDILNLINIVSSTKNIDKKVIIGFLENSIQRIINSQLDPDAKISLDINDNGLILMNQNKLVIDDSEEYKSDSKVVDIHLSEAQKINPTITIGETIASRIYFDDFSRSMFSKIEQSFRIEILNWEKKRIYEKYQPLIGTVVEAKLEDDFGGKGATFTLEDGTICYMPTKYQNQNIKLSSKKYHNVTIEEVYENSKSYQVLVSNDSPNKVREILKREIPEIDRGDIQIVGISRIKGERMKISFRQNPKYEGQLDIKGCIIGQNSERINRVSAEVGEKIDVVLYSDNIFEYIANALSPAKIVSINKKVGTNDYLVVVPNKHNTIAIGVKGANVKLTVELIRVNIDICSYSYAIENNIPINWNGNINAEELEKLDAGFVPGPNQNQKTNNRKQRINRNNWRNNYNADDFAKEIEEMNSEILSYKAIDYSQFDLNKNDSLSKSNSKNLNSNNDEYEEEISQSEINRVNENFNFDKDLLGDLDLNDFNLSDFDDEDE